MNDSSNTGFTPSAPTIDTLQVSGTKLTESVKKLLHDGNIRRIVVKNDQGHTIVEIPVTAGVAVAIVAPVLVAVAAIAAVVDDCTIEVHRIDERVPTA
ncbi:DUF4342 domain-containing protein [Rhodococcus sp. ARC_M12]|uniref:DUF4342 domain-containing protein n=1 Tax=unclassified Rhodococcus (in: high G+C Gram-positive bacteria) TaxID=192944 RepID=UPI001FB4F364|nr:MULTISPECIES: DUF4342 domain-containing protein [unclassified Rhodococcus (in: high G+C Gram-positive bacteria)]MCJ0891975.1 DUF4342 domain-containing protein [Rhodococcus sp. ARC_M5]MCJ0980132.1 DUF4342 domain-containing protein [Rhodococcus sp. ARC_M12]